MMALRAWVLLFFLWIRRSSGGAAADPYAALRVANTASQDDIRQSYRQLCLRYHPDKNMDKPEHERKKYEDEFKQIQKAYSQIGDEEARKNYDFSFSHPGNVFSRPGAPYAFQQRQYGQQQERADDIFRELFRQQQRRSSFGAPYQSMYRSSADMFNLSQFKSIYVQKINVSLEDLYQGKDRFYLSLKASLWQRVTATFRGGAGLVLLYQSLLFSLPMIRVSKLAAIVMGFCVFHAHLPEPDQVDFIADLKAGYKDGTRLTFTEGDCDVVFVLKELRHQSYERRGNDLYTTVHVTGRQAKKGTVVETTHLDGSSLEIVIPAKSKHGTLVRVAEKGWPSRRNASRGDLYAEIRHRLRE
jgi:DnaJ-class molecular chaperone